MGKVTYFPYSQLHHYEPVLQQQTSQSPVVYPDNWQAQPFFDAEGNPSTPFRANNSERLPSP